jgi:hypothetical protein
MTDKHDTNNPEINEILLKACHCSMLMTGESPSKFVSRLHGESSGVAGLISSELRKRLNDLENGDKSFWQRLGQMS